jgi:hypothetical protein
VAGPAGLIPGTIGPGNGNFGLGTAVDTGRLEKTRSETSAIGGIPYTFVAPRRIPLALQITIVEDLTFGI